MKDDAAAWTVIWRALAMTFIDNGYCPRRDVERAARARDWHLRLVGEVLNALSVEAFDYEGEVYFRLSNKVVPIVPNRQSKRIAIGGGAA